MIVNRLFLKTNQDNLKRKIDNTKMNKKKRQKLSPSKVA